MSTIKFMIAGVDSAANSGYFKKAPSARFFNKPEKPRGVEIREKNRNHPARVLIVGLIVAQIIAVLFVYRSNVALFERNQVLEEVGYLVVPNKIVSPQLPTVKSAFWGGLFFTFSAGAGMVLVTMVLAIFWRAVTTFLLKWQWYIYGLTIFLVSLATAWLSASFVTALIAAFVVAVVVLVDWLVYRLSGRRYFLYVPVFTAWLGLVLFQAIWGHSFFMCLILLGCPVVFVLTLRWIQLDWEKSVWSIWAAAVTPLVVVGLAWGFTASVSKTGVFLDVRDYVLWSNPAGRALIDFYYEYTLYPAEVFKSLRQKTLKTAVVAPMDDKDKENRLRRTLHLYDFLTIKDAAVPVDIQVSVKGNEVSLRHEGMLILQPDLDEFLVNANKILGRYSYLTDDGRTLRRFVFYSLFAAMPLTLYILVFSLARWICGLKLGPVKAAVAAGIICTVAGVCLLAPIWYGRSVQGGDAATDLASGSWWRQVAAFKKIESMNLDISDYQYRELLESPESVVRYWLAVALHSGKTEESRKQLLFMLYDEDPNVATMAIRSVAMRKLVDTVPLIEELIRESDHWYVQWYAYRTLKELGWKQELN